MHLKTLRWIGEVNNETCTCSVKGQTIKIQSGNVELFMPIANSCLELDVLLKGENTQQQIVSDPTNSTWDFFSST